MCHIMSRLGSVSGLLLFGATCMTPACGPRGDVIEVMVCGDVALPDDVDAMRVSVLDETRQELRAGTRELVLCPEDRLLTLPYTVEFEGVDSQNAWVVVQGLRQGVEVMRYERRADLEERVIEQVTLTLDRSCLGQTCVLGQTCIKGECTIVSTQSPEGACDATPVILVENEEERVDEPMEDASYCGAPSAMTPEGGGDE